MVDQRTNEHPARVRKAVIPAAGLGTRFLPFSKAVPKEMLPIVDQPVIQYVISEAVDAGIDDILVVTSRHKKVLEDHFDRVTDLEDALLAKGKDDDAAQIRELAEMAQIHFVRQGEALGLGHAIGTARNHVGDQPFAVLLGDDIMHPEAKVLQGMIDTYGDARMLGRRADGGGEGRHRRLRVCRRRPDRGSARSRSTQLVEKPAPEVAPSNLAVMGRYLFTPEIFDEIERTEPGHGGEIQITDAMASLMVRDRLLGYTFSWGRFDTGKKIDYLRAVVELALERPDIGAGVPRDPRRGRRARRALSSTDRSSAGPGSFSSMISLEEARTRINRDLTVLPAVEIATRSARDLVLAETVTADRSDPAVRQHRDGRVRAPLCRRRGGHQGRPRCRCRSSPRSPPAASLPGRLESGEAMRIMTGAPIPDGADAIVMVELTRPAGFDVLVMAEVPAGNHVRAAGDDIQSGAEVFHPGTVLTPGHLGVLASIGRETVEVYRRPRVGVMSTGDELDRGIDATAAGADPRLEPAHAAVARRRGRLSPGGSRVGARRREGVAGGVEGRGRANRRRAHLRRCQHGRLRPGESRSSPSSATSTGCRWRSSRRSLWRSG